MQKHPTNPNNPSITITTSEKISAISQVNPFMLNHNESSASERRLPDNERERFAVHRQNLLSEIQPLSRLEFDLFEQLAASSWDLIRYRRFEDEIFLNEPNPFLNPTSAKALDRIHKYKAVAERSYRAALKEIQRIQTNYAVKALIPSPIRAAMAGIFDSEKVLRNIPKPPKPEKSDKPSKHAARFARGFPFSSMPPSLDSLDDLADGAAPEFVPDAA